MIGPIPINLAVEDPLSESVLRAMISQSGRYAIGVCYKKNGYGYLKANINGFNNAAKVTPFFVLTDLDNGICPSALIDNWLKEKPQCPNLIFRVAVREVESWILAHRSAFAEFLGIKENLIPQNTDQIKDPKKSLVALAGKSRIKNLRDDIVPPAGSAREEGPGYNGCLGYFVSNRWKAEEGRKRSPSLARAWKTLQEFNPSWNVASRR